MTNIIEKFVTEVRENTKKQNQRVPNEHCYKCGHNWFSSGLLMYGIHPEVCPECHSHTYKTPGKERRT